jgi:hypothetical protein
MREGSGDVEEGGGGEEEEQRLPEDVEEKIEAGTAELRSRFVQRPRGAERGVARPEGAGGGLGV